MATILIFCIIPQEAKLLRNTFHSTHKEVCRIMMTSQGEQSIRCNKSMMLLAHLNQLVMSRKRKRVNIKLNCCRLNWFQSFLFGAQQNQSRSKYGRPGLKVTRLFMGVGAQNDLGGYQTFARKMTLNFARKEIDFADQVKVTSKKKKKKKKNKVFTEIETV